ncbi:Predicted ABC-type transport system involved in lysophospholipase L1 biosynthesis, permease component [Amycolatopsis xylanica]|uniref:Predicted ABC-type transport system involved in lysophospholipase L1 biosynthesis, permease component n=1 Tax=Amycolatopsis xylanica TaxID=589385 RepID=A0A1H3JG55_9PSEU|nr:FtsX-like permease family protein [Amycolatopsis xylanica]SDY38184.1 Predicted ABC-type transport system involved in lysophospholipase L1 biosynthesis, permease component [Amycolatopsis xylanica]
MTALPRHRLGRWAGDLALGFRLAVGGGRTSGTGITRLLLGTIGIGIAVTVLLFAASADHAISGREARKLAGVPESTPIAGVAPLTLHDGSTSFRGQRISVRYVHPGGPTSPTPPGLDRIPAPGEMVLSPALADLLRSEDGSLLRPRFAGPEIGTIGVPGLVNPDDLRAYVGADASLIGKPVYAFGSPSPRDGLDPGLLTLLLIGIVSLLAPVFVFVATSARVAGAERDQRLAALRLAGSDLPQVRRIAAAESLVTAACGLALGTGAFLALRQLTPSVRVRDGSLFAADIAPPWPLVAVVVLAVPALSVLSALAALRGTAIEPLGVVRRAKPVRRRLWWRLLPIVLGVLPLATLSLRDGSKLVTVAVATGVACLLIGVPAILPWLLERAVARFHGGRPPLQLAVRRLQLDSGTPARVVAGLAVVLAGAIALQSLLTGQAQALDPGPPPARTTTDLSLNADAQAGPAAVAALAKLPGLATPYLIRQVHLRGADPGRMESVSIADCATWRAVAGIEDCVDGAVYQDRSAGSTIHSGQSYVATYFDEQEREAGTWTVPAMVPSTRQGSYSSVMATPGAMTGLDLSQVWGSATVRVTSDDPDFAEHARNALAPFTWHTSLYLPTPLRQLSPTQQAYLAIRAGLLAAAVFTLLLAGVSLLVLGLEQVRERSRTIGMLAATGVPVRVLARSMVWQNAIPLALGIVIAVATGLGLSALGARLTGAAFTVDWLAVGVLSASAAALVLLVTAVTLPSLRGAARLASVRTE